MARQKWEELRSRMSAERRARNEAAAQYMEMTVADLAYKELLAKELPHAIHNAEEYEAYVARVDELLDLEARSEAEDRFLELLSVLIESYEDETEPIEFRRNTAPSQSVY